MKLESEGTDESEEGRSETQNNPFYKSILSLPPTSFVSSLLLNPDAASKRQVDTLEVVDKS